MTVDRSANVLLFGDGGWFAGVDFRGRQRRPVHGDGGVLAVETDKGTNAERHHREQAPGRRATSIPPEILDLYTDVPDRRDRARRPRRCSSEILADVPSDEPVRPRGHDAGLSCASDALRVRHGPHGRRLRARARSSASPGSSTATASTSPRRWRSCSATRSRTTRSRRGSSRASCPGEVSGTTVHRPDPRRATRGSRSTSRATAGSRSTRRATSGCRRRSRSGRPVPSPSHGASPSSGFEPPDPARARSREPGDPARRDDRRRRPGRRPRAAHGVRDRSSAVGVLALAFAAWLRGPRGEVEPGRGVAVAGAGRLSGSGSGRDPPRRSTSTRSALGELVPGRRTRHRHGRRPPRSRPRTPA